MKTEEKAVNIESGYQETDINEYLSQGWKVKHLCTLQRQGTTSYILVIFEREINT